MLTEVLIEGLGTDPSGRDAAARLHYWIDLTVEIPLVVMVLVTGALLAQRSWPLTPLLWIKIGAGAVAITSNLACSAVVIARYRRRADPVAVRRLHALVRLSALGIPFGAVAAYIGLVHFI